MSADFPARGLAATALAATAGGTMTNPMTTAGDLVVGDTGGLPKRLALGSANYVLSVSGGAPAWVAQSTLAIAAGQVSGLATVATSGVYSDLTGKPSLATVATSGAYSDLTGKPALAPVATSGAYSDLTGKPSLATVATSGAYSDLTGKPTLGSLAALSSVNNANWSGTALALGNGGTGQITAKAALAALSTGAVVTFSNLNGSPADGELAYITDAAYTGTGGILAGGGSLHLPVFYNSANSRWMSLLSPGNTANLTAGYTTTSYSLGTLSSGTTTLSAANGNIQHATNGGAFTLAPQSGASTIVVEIANNASAGAVTTSGYTKVVGEFTTTNGAYFQCVSTVTNAKSALYITQVV